MTLKVFTDGGSKGNPGPSSIGIVMYLDKKRMFAHKENIGFATNNEAEYESVIFGLQKAKLLFGGKKIKTMELVAKMDSEFVVKQLNGKYKILDRRIEQLFLRTWNLKVDFGEVKFTHISRNDNMEADRLVNQALGSRRIGEGLPGI